ncbi:MAG TPA: cupredoxin domain-containing protein [Actinomycetota bacterium]|nr:cupredoxin domain-containing protein [Actinomycetota bacterium]
MAQTLQEKKPAGAHGVEGISKHPTGGMTWRRLLSGAALGAAAGLAAISFLVFKAVVPPVLLMLALLAAGGWLATRAGRVGAIGASLAAAGAAIYAAMGSSFVIGVLGAPEEPREFIPLVAAFVLSVVVLTSAVVLAVHGRGRAFDRSRAASVVAAVTTGLLVVTAAWSLYSGATFESATAASGDLTVGATEFAFTPDVLRAPAGEIFVFVDNTGKGLHTFSSEELGFDVAVPAGKAQRAAFTAGAGEYTFYCKLHPGMEGRLVVY